MRRTLAELLEALDTVEDDLTIYAAKTNGWSGDSEAVAAIEPEDGSTPPEAVGMAYLLEVDMAKEVLLVWSEWRSGATPTLQDRVAAVVHYATHDAYLPVESDR